MKFVITENTVIPSTRSGNLQLQPTTEDPYSQSDSDNTENDDTQIEPKAKRTTDKNWIFVKKLTLIMMMILKIVSWRK